MSDAALDPKPKSPDADAPAPVAAPEALKPLNADERPTDAYDPDDMGRHIEIPPLKDGFTLRSIFGALFVAAIMLPGTIYLGLTVGLGMGTAVEWVTVILFIELARRSFQTLSRQEIYVLLHVAGSLGTNLGGHALSGGVFATLIWNQYLKTSPYTESFNLPAQLPNWVTPDTAIISLRSFISSEAVLYAWLPAIGVAVAGAVLSKVQQLSVSYLAYRLTVDVEKLPFPMAKVGAEGATALAEQSSKTESWRWPVFATGAMIGCAFAAVYTAVPIITGAILAKPIQILPIPFLDLTPYVDKVVPGMILGIALDLGLVLTGFILPWKVVVGTIIGTITGQVLLNPILRHYGILKERQLGEGAIFASLYNSLDLWLSVSIGVAIFIALIGLWHLARTLFFSKGKTDWRLLTKPPANRGDIKLRWPVMGFVLTSIGYIVLCDYLINVDHARSTLLHWVYKPPAEQFPTWIFTAFAFLYTPLMSYMSARMTGITGHGQPFPYVREGTFFMSGYSKPDVWFAPIPLHDYGHGAQGWRVTALTGTPVKSILKADLLTFPLMIVASFIFWSYIWGLAQIPSQNYPYVQQWWPMWAQSQALWATAKSEGTTFLLDAIKWGVIGGTVVAASFLYGGMSLLGIGTGYFYGLASGITALPHGNITLFLGAVLGRYYLRKKFGAELWSRYAPVLLAGYFCGAGLMGMLAIAVVFFRKAVFKLPY